MKNFCIALVFLLPLLGVSQQRESQGSDEIQSHNIRRGFFGNVTFSPVSSYFSDPNIDLSGGMHFSGFYVGILYHTTLEYIETDQKNELHVQGLGLDFMYEIPVTRRFSIAPYLAPSINTAKRRPLGSEGDAVVLDEDRYLNFDVGAKLWFAPNANFRIGAEIGYNSGFGVDMLPYADSDFNGTHVGLNIQFNQLFPKY